MDAVKRTLGLLAIALVAVVVACGGGGAKDGDAPVDDTTREITNEQLAQMVLALADFGPEYGGFAPETSNGAATLESASEGDFDPEAERADLNNFGWAAGFEAYYAKDSAEDGAGSTFVLGSSAAVFRDVDAASGYLKDSQAEITDDLGKTTDDGFTLTQMEEFPVEAGNEAIAARGVGTFTNEDGSTGEVWLVSVLMRRGRVTGVVSAGGLVGNNDERIRIEGKVTGLASLLNDRMASVLAATAPSAPPAAAEQ